MSQAAVLPRTPRNQSFAMAALAAVLLALAMPGRIGISSFLFVALVPLLVMIPRLTARRSACMGLFCGLLYNIALLYWIVIALHRYGRLSWWIAVAGMTLLALYMAVYISFFCLLLNLVIKKLDRSRGHGYALLWAAPVIWLGLDWVRSWLGTGFPWMDLAYGLYLHPLLLQAADLGGHHLVTFAVVMVNGLVAFCLLFFAEAKGERAKNGFVHCLLAAGLLTGLAGYSYLRHDTIVTSMAGAETAVLGVAQGNISQDEKWGKGNEKRVLHRYLDLSAQAVANQAVDLIVWPETAMPFFLQGDRNTRKILSFLQEKKTALLTGAPAYTQTGPGHDPTDFAYFNSAFMLDPRGNRASRYDKQHLVPFGEYVPLRSMFPFIEPLVVAAGDFTAGISARPLLQGKMQVGVLICFEAIFPAIARQETMAGANVLANLTNDAWYGRSSAPYQSLAMSVLRAVENRRSLVRSANTGFSGFIDPTGAIVAQSPLFAQTAMVQIMPLMANQTFFARGGHWFAFFCFCMSLLLLLWWPLSKKIKTRT